MLNHHRRRPHRRATRLAWLSRERLNQSVNAERSSHISKQNLNRAYYWLSRTLVRELSGIGYCIGTQCVKALGQTVRRSKTSENKTLRHPRNTRGLGAQHTAAPGGWHSTCGREWCPVAGTARVVESGVRWLAQHVWRRAAPRLPRAPSRAARRSWQRCPARWRPKWTMCS